MFLNKYKLNPFELFNNMSLLDFDSYISRLNQMLEEENNNKDKKDTFANALTYVRDVLNTMPLG